MSIHTPFLTQLRHIVKYSSAVFLFKNNIPTIFLTFIEEECQELELNARRSKDVAGIELSAGVSCFSEVIPIMQFIISRLDESQRLQNYNIMFELKLTKIMALFT